MQSDRDHLQPVADIKKFNQLCAPINLRFQQSSQCRSAVTHEVVVEEEVLEGEEDRSQVVVVRKSEIVLPKKKWPAQN